jgi:hypothetical protein
MLFVCSGSATSLLGVCFGFAIYLLLVCLLPALCLRISLLFGAVSLFNVLVRRTPIVPLTILRLDS